MLKLLAAVGFLIVAIIVFVLAFKNFRAIYPKLARILPLQVLSRQGVLSGR